MSNIAAVFANMDAFAILSALLQALANIAIIVAIPIYYLQVRATTNTALGQNTINWIQFMQSQGNRDARKVVIVDLVNKR
jgi:hypothetical protein